MLRINFKGIDYGLKADGTIFAKMPSGNFSEIKRTSKRYRHILYAFKQVYSKTLKT